jgi:hypothetical protein
LTVKGFWWTVFGAIITVTGLAIPPIVHEFVDRSARVDEHVYTVILENELGDPMPDADVDLIGEGGPFHCTTNSDGVCTVEHVPSLSSLSVRISKEGKKLYERQVPTANPVIRFRLPKSQGPDHKEKGNLMLMNVMQIDKRGFSHALPH